MNKTQEIFDAIKEVSVVLAPLKEKLKSNRRFVKTLLHFFSDVTDFREPGKVKYKLENILCICLLMAMRGEFTSFHNASLFIKVKVNYFKKLKLIEGKDIPSHDTLRRIFMYIDANELRDSLQIRISEMINKIVKHTDASKNKMRLLNGDGKNFKGSGRKDGGKRYEDGLRNVNVLNVLDASSSLVISSVPLDDKESEIPAFQRLLPKYNLENTMVTADALHCQVKTLDLICKRKGEYTIKVKDNQPGRKQHLIDTLNLNKEKQQYFYFNECEYWIYIIDYKPTDLDFPHAQAYVRMVSHKRADQADYNPEDQYFVSSANNTQLIMEAIDNRWQVEQFHNYKDDFLKEDKCTFTDKNAIQVMAIFNNIAYALYRIASAIFDDSCMAETRIRFKDCPEEMLALLVPLLEKQNLTMLLKQNMRGRKKST